MSNFTFAPPNMDAPGDKKNFVFVDEHNRHRRLKAVRACDGCRRRKIKCDSATTNQWPCAACVRLKLHCVPPTTNGERSTNAIAPRAQDKIEMQRILDFDLSDGSGEEDVYQDHESSYDWTLNESSDSVRIPATFTSTLGPYGTTPPYPDLYSAGDFQYAHVNSLGLSESHSSFTNPSVGGFPVSTVQGSSNGSWTADPQYSAADLSEILGELKINESGVPPYISQQKKILAEAPAYQEPESDLPKFTSQSGTTVRIPPELMPSDEQCLQYFEIYFTNIHPYVPVISKPYFYQQWRNNRRSISPLILEAIFACAGRMSEDAAQGAQWIALASSHEDCFMDVPRLSTVQAMMILLKARESAPKRGYYYRSWITVKKLVTMAHDLDLHEHYDLHKNGSSCGSDPTECLVKTRIWQTLFVMETMIGAPQGRSDMGVDPNTVDPNVLQQMPGIDISDYEISRQFTYMTRKVIVVRKVHDLKGKIKEIATADWANHPQMIATGETLDKWLKELPKDLTVDFPIDDTPPWLKSHVVGNMHCYYYLTIIMVRRPQLMHSASYADDTWKKHMRVCYESSKRMCRLQEAILQTFGINGLLCMQRGIGFVIYAVLTCTMVHLVAITTPDAEFNKDGKEYFTRHMRILEICTTAWPQADMQKQIDALRDAFSADTSRPFELKASFPHGSPISGLQPSPPAEHNYPLPHITRTYSNGQMDVPTILPFQPDPMTPPMTGELDGSLSMSLGLLTPNNPQHTVISDAAASWNPTPIFEGWNIAFGDKSASMADVNAALPDQSPPFFSPPISAATLHHPLTPTTQTSFAAPTISVTGGITGIPRSRINSTPNVVTKNKIGFSPTDQPSFMTSNMWRESIASTYDRAALKRAWDHSSSVPAASNGYLSTDTYVQMKRQR